MQIEIIFAYVSMGSILVPIFFGLSQLRKLKGSLSILFFLLVASLVMDIIAFTLSRHSMNTYLLGNLFFLFQFVMIAFIFSQELNHSKWMKYIIFVILIFFIYNLLVAQGLFVFNTHSNSVAGLTLVAISLYFFFDLLKNLPQDDIYRLPMFWIAFAVLFYYGGTLILFLTNNFLVDRFLDSHRLVWILHNFCNIVKNLLLAIALWHNYRNLKHSL
jgi:hypothetical protein